MKLLKLNIDDLILFFLSLFIVSFFNEHMTAVKNIGIYTALSLSIYKILTDTNKIKQNIWNTIIRNKYLIIIFITLILLMFLASAIAYDNPAKSIRYLFKEIQLGILFLVVLFTIYKTEKFIKYILLSFTISMLLGNIHFLYKAISLWEYIDISSFTIDRFYSGYFEVTYPFVLAFFFYLNNKYYKIIVALILLSGVILMLLTGARGTWMALFIETIIILILFWRNITNNLKIFISFSSILFIIIFYTIYINFNIVNNKTNQHFDTSGRTTIITDRFPIILENNNLVIGMGYGTFQYTKFMNDYNAPKRIGRFNDKESVYFHDEPYILSFFYHFGTIGVILFLVLIIYFIKHLLHSIKTTKHIDKLYLIAILSSFIGVFIIRGLFEDRHFAYFIILFSLFVIHKSNYENSIHIPRKITSKKC